MKIKIGCHEYEVIEKETIILNGDAVCGKIDTINGHIHICTEMCDNQRYSTLIHEIVHGILEEIGNPFAELMDEEHFVKPFANVLSQVLKDNEL